MVNYIRIGPGRISDPSPRLHSALARYFKEKISQISLVLSFRFKNSAIYIHNNTGETIMSILLRSYSMYALLNLVIISMVEANLPEIGKA